MARAEEGRSVAGKGPQGEAMGVRGFPCSREVLILALDES